MTRNDKGRSQPLPGTVATLTSGFEITTKHLWVIVLPILLDLFYWLGPRIGVTSLLEQYNDIFGNEPAFNQLMEPLLQMAPQINVFTNLSLPLVGVPALMNGAVPEKTPLNPVTYELHGAAQWSGLLLLFSLVGLALTTVYLVLIRFALKTEVNADEERFASVVRAIFVSYFRMIGLAIVFFVLVVMAVLPLLPIAFVLGLFNGSLSLAVMFVGVVLVVIHLSMAVPGVILNDRPFLHAVRESIRLVHRNLLPTLNLLLLFVVISSVTNLLWRLADDGSWLTLVSIAGHGFISTALVAALFIFYRDRFRTMID